MTMKMTLLVVVMRTVLTHADLVVTYETSITEVYACPSAFSFNCG